MHPYQINLLRGWPAPCLLPSKTIAEATASVLSERHPDADRPHELTTLRNSLAYKDLRLSDKALLYGPDEGHLPLRKSLSTMLSRYFAPTTRPNHERIAITGGASQSLGIILTRLSDPSYTRRVWIVAPGYFMAFKIFEDAGFCDKIRSVPETKDGPDVSWLRRELDECEKEWTASKRKSGETDEPKEKPKKHYPKIFKHIIYTVPNFSNPAGVTTSLEVREELVRCAREYDALVVCDDVYDMLHWPSDLYEDVNMQKEPTAILPRVVDVDSYLPESAADGFGNVISNGTFSKILAPGLRCGWVEGTEKLAHIIAGAGATMSGGAPSQMTSTVVDHLLRTGELEEHIRTKLRPAYRRRWTSLRYAIKDYLEPLGARVAESAKPEVAGGYFIWLHLPHTLYDRSEELAQRCLAQQNLVVASGKLFEVPGDHEGEFDNNIRLCFAWEAEPDMVEGIKRLMVVMKDMISEDGGASAWNGLRTETTSDAFR